MTEMSPLPRAHSIVAAQADDPVILLSYGERLLRRRRLTAADGTEFMVDLAETRGLDEGDAFLLEDGRRIAVTPAPERLLDIQGDLARLAWHIGNRHTPCEFTADALRIAEDHVLEAMLRQLGAEIHHVLAPFRPEGGAYGHGRTMGHDHGPAEPAHDHGHDHDHGHAHDHTH